MRNAFIDTIIECCKVRDDVFIVTGDAGLGVFDEFRIKYPDRFLNMGVAEQNMAGFSAGLAMSGYKVILYNIIPFLLYRCYEQIRNDICYQELPVVLTGIGSGVTYAPMGMTHYSVEDIGIARTLPNLTVLSPVDPIEAHLAALYSLESSAPVYVRLAKKGEPVINRNEKIDITLPQVIRDGEDIAIIFHGSVGEEILSAREILLEEGIVPRLITIPMIQPLNWGALACMLKGIKYVFVVEEHYKSTGLGSVLRDRFCHDKELYLNVMGIDDNFIHEVKDLKGMREHFNISCHDIARHILNSINRGDCSYARHILSGM